MKTDTKDFLEALLFTAHNPDNEDNETEGATIYDFSPKFVAAVDEFVSRFREFAEEKGLDPDAPERSFGGNVYFSLSGHGCGFWDDAGEEGDKLQVALEEFAKSRYQFEEMDCMLSRDENGQLDLAILPEFVDIYREQRFAYTTK